MKDTPSFRTLLYEGSGRRILSGTLWPEGWEGGQAYGERSSASAQMLVRGDEPRISAAAHFLRPGDPPREEIAGAEVTIEPVTGGVFKVTVTIRNRLPIKATATRDEAERHAFGAAHAILDVDGGEWISVSDPPEELAPYASALVQDGLHPVLLGKKGETKTMLVAPITLGDHPEIASARK